MADERPDVWLIRHGETEWSRTGRHTGRTDVPLTEAGREQATALAGALTGETFARVLTSPLRRATETCALAGFGPVAEERDELVEWGYGDYEGVTTAQIRETVRGWTVWAGATPGGETTTEVGARVDALIDEVRRGTGAVLLFSHGHLLRALAARWLGLEVAHGRLLALDPSTISILGWEREQPVLRRWNAPAARADGPTAP